MAKQPHRDDDPAKKPNGAQQPPAPPTPKPVMPNMSLDEPEEEALEVEEVLEDDAPIAESAPASEVEPFILADDDVIAEEVVEVMPIEEEMPVEAMPIEAEDVEDDVLFAEAVEEAGSSGVLVEVMPSEVVPAVPAEEPEVDLLSMFEEESAPPAVTEPPTAEHEVAPPVVTSSFADKLASASAPVEPLAEPVAAEAEADFHDLFDEPAMEDSAAEIAAAAPASEVKAEDAVFEGALAEAAPASEVFAAHDVLATAPASEVFAAEEVVEEATPASEVFAAEEVVEEVAEAAPASEVKAEDVLLEEALAESASEARSAEVVEEVAEAVEEVSSATRKSEAVLDDEVAEAEAASAAEVFEEATAEEAAIDGDEVTEAGSSAVLFDEAVDVGSAAKKPVAGKTADSDKTVAFGAASSTAKKADSDVLVTEEEIAGTSEASAVDLGDMPARKGSSVTGIDKVAEALESGVDLEGEAEQGDPLAETVPSVEFDELLDDLGDSAEAETRSANRKKPSSRDVDTSAEMDANALQEAALAYEEETGATKKKGAAKGKPAKAAAVATGADIDVGDHFDEAEAAEAMDAEEAEAAEALDAEEAFDAEEAEAAEALNAEEAAEAEAAEAFDEEMDATEAFDAEEAEEAVDFDEDIKLAKKTKMGAKTRLPVDDDEEAEAIDDDEEDVSAQKKKGKKDKTDKREKATVAPAPAQTSTLLRIFIGMVLATLMISGAAVAGWFLAEDPIKDLAKSQLNLDDKRPAPKVVEKTKVELAHADMDKYDFAGAVKKLDGASADDELSLRGEAKWLGYVSDLKKAAPDGDDPRVKDAILDLEKAKAKNEVLLGQIKTTLEQKALRDNVDKLTVEKTDLDKKLTSATTDKDAAEKKVDAVVTVLVKSKLIDDKADFNVGMLEKILTRLNADKAVLDAVNKVLDKEVKGTGEEGLKEVLKIKKGFEDNLAKVDQVLADEKTKAKGDKGVLEIVDARNKMTKDRDDLIATVGAAFKELVDGKIVEANPDPRKQIVDGVKQARKKAESPLSIPLAQLGMSLGGIGTGTSKVVEQSFDMAKVFSELGYFKTREPFIERPDQKMNTYITLLQDRRQNDPKRLAAITREAEWVRDQDSKADAESRSKARYVQGLALRNEEKFAEAKAAFAETLKMIPSLALRAGWTELARKSQKELTDPNEHYLPRMEQFLAAGNLKAALAEAIVALKAMPTDARLFAQRGLIRYEMVRGKGAKIPDEAQKEIRADAATARKDEKAAAESAYLVGLLEEELGNWAEADKLYRQAIKLHVGAPDDAGKYRVALARLLLRDPPEGGAAPAPADNDKKKKDDKVGAIQAPQERTIVLHPWTPFLVSAVIGQPVEDIEDKETAARLNETLKLAEELIASKNAKIKGQGYLLKGIALSKMGRRTEGLKEYAKGLQLIDPGTKTEDMSKLIEDHPAFQQPDASNTPNEIMAERHFGEGMHHYWSKQYPQAEAQFRQSVKYYNKDARYQYYLGLAQIHQKTRLKRDAAYYSFERGARLEAKMASTNPDAVREINASLERIQGEMRQLLNDFRYKAKADEQDAK
jgi:hypothetical protein